MEQLEEEGIDTLVIAGDLFDQQTNNPSSFDQLCQAYPAIRIYVIPGNHDPQLHEGLFTADNLSILTEPQLIGLGDGNLPCFFLPYQPESTMGNALARFEADHESLRHHVQWLLVGHGDYLGMKKPVQPYEPGIYMPLTGHDLERFQPSRVILGHIHQRQDEGIVHYPGSPCGLDITETGKRYFTLLDTEDLTLYPRQVQNPTLYMNETLVILPLPDEEAYIAEQVQAMLDQWQLNEAELAKVYLRLVVKGYTHDKSRLADLLTKHLPAIHWYDGAPDLSQVHVNPDPVKADLVEKIKERIEVEASKLASLNVDQQSVLAKAMERVLQPSDKER